METGSTVPARQECLEYALAADKRHGIWGGKFPAEERRRMGRSSVLDRILLSINPSLSRVGRYGSAISNMQAGILCPPSNVGGCCRDRRCRR